MKIENLTEGLVVKNYKEMCALLEIKVEAGNSKKAQLKELERFIKYHKEGNKFVIDVIYETPLEKIENRGGSKSIYEEDIQALILHECSISEMEEFKSIKLSCVGLANKLNIINNNYVYGRNHINKFSDYLSVPVETIHDFYDSTQRKNKSIIENSLNKLKDKALIKWYRILRVRTNKGDYKDATDREINIITEIEQEALAIVGEESKQAVFLKRKWNEYNKIINELLIKHETNIAYYFEVYKIITTSKFESMLLEKDLYSQITDRLNCNIINSEIKSCTKRYNKAIDYADKHNFEEVLGFNYYFDNFKKMDENGYKFKSDKMRSSDTYLTDTKKIIDICINKNTEINLSKEISNNESNKVLETESVLPF